MNIKIQKRIWQLFVRLGQKDISHDAQYHIGGYTEEINGTNNKNVQHVMQDLINLGKKDGWINFVIKHYSIIHNSDMLKNNVKIYIKNLFKKNLFKGKHFNNSVQEGLDSLFDHAADICNPENKFLVFDHSEPLFDNNMNWDQDMMRYASIFAPSADKLAEIISSNIGNGVTPSHQIFYEDGETLESLKRNNN